ncbi:MAG: hypothetical protein KGL69_06560 [Alphaproteobacteria bacterium]|nr:hypothetical protein [Alphaproteobacteria bacterium]
MAGPSLAASPIDGTWTVDLRSVSWSGSTIDFLVTADTFIQSQNGHSFTIPIDGKPHPFTLRPDRFDALAVTQVRADGVDTVAYKAGRPVYVDHWRLGPDRATLTETVVDPGPTGELKYQRILVRQGQPPVGGLAISGSWRRSHMSVGMPGLVVNAFEDRGDALAWSNGAGMSYLAKFDGTKAPQINDPGQTLVSVKKISDHEYVETDWRGGRETDVFTMVVSPDGTTLTTTDDDLRTGAREIQVAHKP